MSIVDALGVIAAIVGTVGVVGAAVLWFTAPVILAGIVRALWKLLALAWKTRLGVAVIVGALCLFVGDWNGDRRVQAEWDAARAAARTVAATTDNNIAAKATTADQQNTNAEIAADEIVKGSRDAFLRYLAASPRPSCVLTDDDVRWLRVD